MCNSIHHQNDTDKKLLIGVYPARQRAFASGLVAIGATLHPNAHAQGPRYRDPPRPLDDMEAPQRLHLQRSVPIREHPPSEDQGRGRLLGKRGRARAQSHYPPDLGRPLIQFL